MRSRVSQKWLAPFRLLCPLLPPPRSHEPGCHQMGEKMTDLIRGCLCLSRQGIKKGCTCTNTHASTQGEQAVPPLSRSCAVKSRAGGGGEPWCIFSHLVLMCWMAALWDPRREKRKAEKERLEWERDGGAREASLREGDLEMLCSVVRGEQALFCHSKTSERDNWRASLISNNEAQMQLSYLADRFLHTDL